MDSMRNLRSSLPPARRNAQIPPAQLLQAFKQAALSVTELYKQAASEQADAYQEGYRDALEDLISFLDKEELGLQDGEGRKIRRWTTDRFQGLPPSSRGSGNAEKGESEDEDEGQDANQERERSSSPMKSSIELPPRRIEMLKPTLPTLTEARSISAPPVQSSLPQTVTTTTTTTGPIDTFVVPSSEFSFRSSHGTPAARDADMDSSQESQSPAISRTNSASGTLHLNIGAARRNRHNSNRSGRPGNNNSSLGHGAGSKRRAPLDTFFDIGGFNGRDGFGGGGAGGLGGGKRGRFS